LGHPRPWRGLADLARCPDPELVTAVKELVRLANADSSSGLIATKECRSLMAYNLLRRSAAKQGLERTRYLLASRSVAVTTAYEASCVPPQGRPYVGRGS
jgi:hypothetical protein